jgi:hypothetical protein
LKLKLKESDVVARLFCETCLEEKYVIAQVPKTWHCDGCHAPLIPCHKCLMQMQHCDVCENGSHFVFDVECEGRR